jgi:hypothetical protein
VLAKIFEAQAYAALVVGSLLAFNVIWPTVGRCRLTPA